MTQELEQQKNQGGMAKTNDTASVMQAIVTAAQSSDVDPEKMERMMGLYERMEAKKAESEFARAMNECQQEMGRVSADAENQHTKSKYASYAALDRALRPVYASHGFSLSFDTGDAPEGYVRVLCYVSHQAGHTRTYTADMPADGMGSQGKPIMTKTHARGSAMSYGMRYLLKMIFNVAIGEDDDDGNTADISELAEAIRDIESAPSMDELQATFKSKWHSFTGKDDRKRLTAAKDVRKRELSND